MRYIYEMSSAFSKADYVRMFMPGHKGKSGYPRDLTEVDYLDDLACPNGAIKKANERIAKCYGYDYATMATCGSTVCIHAMLLCSRGKVLMGRNAHKSAINAVYLYNIPNEFVDMTDTDILLSAIDNTDAGTLYVTYPDYYGNGVDIEKVIERAKAKDMLVIVDSAHGAHYYCHKDLPPVPKADMMCVSVHKTMGSLTSGAAVMCSSEYENVLFDNLFRVHTTSPSYVIMESIDDAYSFIEDNPMLIDKWIEKCKEAREILSKSFIVADNKDVTRLVLSKEGYTGYELYDIFKEKGILAEMCDLESIVLLTSPYDLEGIDRLYEVSCDSREKREYDFSVPTGEKAYPIYYVKNKETEKVYYKEALGRISVKPIGAYPPGTAAVMPGERITKEVIDYIERILSYKGKLFSVEDGYLQVTKNEG